MTGFQNMPARTRHAGTGQAEQDRQNRTDRHNMKGKTGECQAKEDRQNQDRQNRTAPGKRGQAE
jgi:hypothetical protein